MGIGRLSGYLPDLSSGKRANAALTVAVLSVSDFAQKRFDFFMFFKGQIISKLYFLSGQRFNRKKFM
jgi:hypothetical protein